MSSLSNYKAEIEMELQFVHEKARNNTIKIYI